MTRRRTTACTANAEGEALLFTFSSLNLRLLMHWRLRQKMIAVKPIDAFPSSRKHRFYHDQKESVQSNPQTCTFVRVMYKYLCDQLQCISTRITFTITPFGPSPGFLAGLSWEIILACKQGRRKLPVDGVNSAQVGEHPTKPFWTIMMEQAANGVEFERWDPKSALCPGSWDSKPAQCR